MSNFYYSKEQLEVGGEGEAYVMELLQNSKYYADVKHLTDDKYNHLRKFDIDYVCSYTGKIDDDVLLRGDITEINQKYITVELKTDNIINRTGNMFLEDYMIRDRDSKRIDGYMNKCKATVFLYYDNVKNILYGCEFSKLKSFYDRNKNNKNIFIQPPYPTRSEIVGTHEKCNVYGYLVKASLLMNQQIMIICNPHT